MMRRIKRKGAQLCSILMALVLMLSLMPTQLACASDTDSETMLEVLQPMEEHEDEPAPARAVGGTSENVPKREKKAKKTPDIPQEPRPDRKSAYAPMTCVGMAVQILLMSIPVIGLILSILWACGVCRKITRRNLARAYLILLIFAIIIWLFYIFNSFFLISIYFILLGTTFRTKSRIVIKLCTTIFTILHKNLISYTAYKII